MNNEIKEILDDLDYAKNKERGTITLNQKDINLLLDYITNLQQENERLKRKLTIKKLFKKHKVQTPENFEIRKIFELQRRIEKAVEYLKDNACYTDENEFVSDLRYDDCEELLNILNGRSDE